MKLCLFSCLFICFQGVVFTSTHNYKIVRVGWFFRRQGKYLFIYFHVPSFSSQLVTLSKFHFFFVSGTPQFLGINHLHKGSKGQSLRSPLCSLFLLAYHTWITQYLGKWHILQALKFWSKNKLLIVCHKKKTSNSKDHLDRGLVNRAVFNWLEILRSVIG